MAASSTFAGSLTQDRPCTARPATTRGSLVRPLTLLFVLLLPATDVLAPHPWLPPPLIAAILLGGLLLLRPAAWRFEPQDLGLVGVLVAGMLPYGWSLEYAGPETPNHLLALGSSILLYYAVARAALRAVARGPRGLDPVLDALALSLLLTSAYVLWEFAVTNLRGPESPLLLPHLTRPDYLASVLHRAGLFVARARGLASESGSMALFFELALFAAYPAVRRRGSLVTLLVYATALAAFTVLFSVGAAVSMLVAVSVFAALSGPVRALQLATVVGSLALAVGLAFPEEVHLFLEQTVRAKLSLALGGPNVGSAGDRIELYAGILDLASDFPFGIGWGIAPALAETGRSLGGHSLAAGQVSLYGFVLVGAGVAGLALFGAFLLRTLWRTRRAGRLSAPLLLAGLSLSVHHTIVAEYWLPNLWLWAALVAAAAPPRRLRPPSAV